MAGKRPSLRSARVWSWGLTGSFTREAPQASHSPMGMLGTVVPAKNHVLTRAAVSAALMSCLFLPHNCEWSRLSHLLHKEIKAQGQQPGSFGDLTVVWEGLS